MAKKKLKTAKKLSGTKTPAMKRVLFGA